MTEGPDTARTPATATAEAYANAGLGHRSEPGRRPALLVVDLVLGFTDPASPLACDTDVAVATAGQLVTELHRLGQPVFFTTVAYDDADLKTARTFLAKVPGLAALRSGSRWSELDPRLGREPEDTIVTKLFASAFFGTDLPALLADRGCDTLVIAGASTSGCVRASVVDAMQHGYPTIVAREAVADRSAEAHRVSLTDIDSRYGDVWSAADTLAWLRRLG